MKRRKLLRVAEAVFGLGMIGVVGVFPLQAQTVAAVAPVVTSAPTADPLKGNFAQRLMQFYREDWKGTLPSSPATARRGPDPPLDSPPFPSGDWSYGGSVDIGAPDGNVYPAMTALGAENHRAKLYGWIAPGLDFSTSGKTNAPEVYDATPNRLELNQSLLVYERLPDTVQTKKFDWGYHFTGLFGTDYRYTTAKGIFSKQLLKHNRQYGADVPIEYVDLYYPGVAKGMNIRVGRFISVPGIEAQLAPNNYIFSHSILYYIDPFTDTGVITTVKLSDRWLVQGGIIAGHDVAPWTSDAKASGTACVDYTSKDVNNNVYVCANGINSAKFAYDNVQQFDATWYHRFSKTWHVASEGWFMYQRDVPNTGAQVVHPAFVQSGVSGAQCYGLVARCTAPEYAIENYVEHEVNSKLIVSFRTELVDDKKGQRTGYATKYTDNTLSAARYFGSTVMLRPELRFDHAYDVKAFDFGRDRSQFTVASDLIYRF